MPPASGKEERAGPMDAVLRHSPGRRELFRALERLVQGRAGAAGRALPSPLDIMQSAWLRD